MRATIFRIVLGAAMFAGAPIVGAVAADEPDNGLKNSLPDWFNKQSREYYSMPVFVVPVIQGSDVTRQVSFLVTLETMGSVNREKVMDKRPQLQDAFLRDLYGVTAVKPDTDVYDSGVLKIRLRRVTERLLGEGVVDDILINVTYDRRVAPAMLPR